MVDNSQSRLNQAIRLSQAGEKKKARTILMQLIQENSANEYAWLWLIDVCDSDRERKAVLSRGLKLNPKSKLLQTAMKRFIDTGSLTMNEDSLDDLVIETRVDQIVEKRKPAEPKRDALTRDGSDLDWISLESESENEANTLDTISDDEFSRLSQEFFVGDMEGESASFNLNFGELDESEELEETPSEAAVEGNSSGLFLLDEILAEENKNFGAASTNSDPLIDLDDFVPSEKTPVAIEDRLKGAFVEDDDGTVPKKKRFEFKLPDFRAISRHALVIIVSAFWLLVFVLVGLFVIQYFQLDEYLSLGREQLQPTATDMIPVEGQLTDQPEEEMVEELPEETPTPIPIEAALQQITSDSYHDLTVLETSTQPFPILLSQDGALTAILDLRTVQLQDAGGSVFWEHEMESSRAIGGGFSADGKLLGIFCDDMSVKIWATEDGTLVNEFVLTPEMELVYADIPYLPGDAEAWVEFSFDNQYVAAAYWGGVTIWKAETAEIVHEYSLPQSILVNAFNSGDSLNSAVAFHPNAYRIAYGIRENIYLVDVAENLVLQNWKTQYVGSLQWYDDGRLIEAGYPLNNLDSYLAVWTTSDLSPFIKMDSLNATRGHHLPCYAAFPYASLLAFEEEGAESMKVSLKVVSLIDGLEISTIPLDTFQPLLGLVGMSADTVLAVWAQVPKEGFGVSDQIQFWDVDTLEMTAYCLECSFLSGILADKYGLYLNDQNTLITQHAQGIGIQQLGIPLE